MCERVFGPVYNNVEILPSPK